MNRGPFHRRLHDFEEFDHVEFKVVPRFKTSPMSGDEWRQHVQVTFSFKGRETYSLTAWDMDTALSFARFKYQEKVSTCVPDAIVAGDLELCDQPSCRNKWVTKLKLKRLATREGQLLDRNEGAPGGYYRKFCAVHAHRGDGNMEDCDENYVLLEGPKPDRAANVQESPAGLALIALTDGEPS